MKGWRTGLLVVVVLRRYSAGRLSFVSEDRPSLDCRYRHNCGDKLSKGGADAGSSQRGWSSWRKCKYVRFSDLGQVSVSRTDGELCIRAGAGADDRNSDAKKVIVKRGCLVCVCSRIADCVTKVRYAARSVNKIRSTFAEM